MLVVDIVVDVASVVVVVVVIVVVVGVVVAAGPKMGCQVCKFFEPQTSSCLLPSW